MNQEFTSANTSINKTKLPSIYRLNLLHNTTILDYGCGKYIDHIKKYANNLNCTWYGYDKFNQSENTNKEALNYKSDIVLCSNVLNVIKENSIVLDIVKECIDHANKMAIFSIYEGNKSGIGKQSKTNCYQRNEKKEAYIKLLQDNGYNPLIKKGFIFLEK